MKINNEMVEMSINQRERELMEKYTDVVNNKVCFVSGNQRFDFDFQIEVEGTCPDWYRWMFAKALKNVLENEG